MSRDHKVAAASTGKVFEHDSRFAEFLKESDRGFVLLLHPFILGHLAEAVQEHARGLIEGAGLTENDIKQASTGLRQIKGENVAFLAFAMGVITAKQFVGIRDLTDLRNLAAHPEGPFTLEDPKTRQRALGIVRLLDLDGEGQWAFVNLIDSEPLSLRVALVTVGYIVATRMLQSQMDALRARARILIQKNTKDALHESNSSKSV